MNWNGFMQIAPPGARGKFTPDLYTREGWVAETKLDGDRRIAQFCESPHGYPRVRFTGRRVSDKDGLLVEKTDCLPHLSGEFASTAESEHLRAPVDLVGTVLDGEMVVDKPGARSKDVTSIIGSKPDLAIKKQVERGWLVYVVFDCLFYKGEDIRDLPLRQRRAYALMAVTDWGNPYVRTVDFALQHHSREQFVLDIWAQGGEGIILKDLESKYGNEKAWVKVKKEFTEDVVIIGYDEPEAVTEKRESYLDENGVKKYRVLEVSESRLAKNGWIGALRFGQYKLVEKVNLDEMIPDLPNAPWSYAGKDGLYQLVYCGSCSGMNDALRAEISANKEKFLGKVAEVLANEREPTGRFRHPRMVQIREDKNATDCIWGQK